MTKKVIGLSLFIVSIVLASSQADSVWQKVKDRYQKVNTAQGSFHQNLCSESLGTCQEFIGWFYLKRPNKLRLDVTYPTRQRIVVFGNKVWYRFSPEEVSEQELSSPLSPFDIFLDTFPLIVIKGEFADSLFYLKLVAQDSLALINFLELWVSPKDYAIKKLSYPQGPGTIATFEFFQVKYNKKIDDKTFKPPRPNEN